jgi:hypothetical protein
MTVPREVIAGWEQRFPGLFGKWTHWSLTGDGHLIALIPGKNLLEAIRIVEANCTRYSSVVCCRAAVDESGNCTEVQKATFAISNAENDKQLIANMAKPQNYG